MRRSSKRRNKIRRRRSLLESLENRLLLATDWQNPVDSRDVSGDGLVAPDDVLRVINFLNSEGVGPLPARQQPHQPFLDVTGDGFASSGDVLRLINLLNAEVPTPYQLVSRPAGSEGSLRIGLGQEYGSRVYSFAVDTDFASSDNGERLEVYLVDPANPNRTLLDGGSPGTPFLILENDQATYPEEVVRFEQGVARIDLTSLGDLAEGEMVFQLISEEESSTEVAIHPLSNEVFDGLLLTNFPVPPTDGVVTLEAEWLDGTGGFQEIGFIPLDDANGALDGLLPDDPGFAEAVHGSSQRQVLFSDHDAIGEFQEVQFTSPQWLGLYVFQKALEPALEDHLVVNSTGEGIWEIGWEDSTSIWPGLPNLGNRGYDDAVLRVTQVDGIRPLDLLPIDDQTIDEETLLELALDAVGGESIAARTFELVSGPEGATLNPQSGIFSWTPTESQGPGAFEVTARLSEGGVSDVEQFQITVVEVNSPPVLAEIGPQSVDEGATLQFTAVATDRDIPSNNLTFSLGVGSPAGATIDPTSGEFNWTPGESAGPGSYDVTVRVTDAGGLSDAENVTITVAEVNQPPRLEAIEDRVVTSGTTVSLTAAATDPDLPPNELRFSLAAGPPSGASIDEVTGRFSWTPPAPGEYPITVQVTDSGGLTDTETFRVQAREVDRLPPNITPIEDQATDEGQPLQFTVTATDPDSPASSLQFRLEAGAPLGATINATTGDFAWTPTESQGPGTFSVSVTVTDEAGLTDTETVSITVREVNLPPQLDPIDDRAIDVGQTVMLNATASDPDLPANVLQFSLEPGAPAGATIDSGTGEFTWQPTTPGERVLTVRVTDEGGLSDTESFLVSVRDIDRAPPILAAIGDQAVDEEQTLSLVVSATDADSPLDSLRFSLVTGAPAGLTVDGTTGQLTWTPAESDGPGMFDVTVQVEDDHGLTDTETFTIVVREVNRPPVLNPISNRFVQEGESVSFVASATDPDLPTNMLTFSLAAGAPQGAAIDPQNGRFDWTPTDAGTFQLTIQVSDNGSPSLSDTETISITTDCPFDVSQWTTRQSGGTPAGQGSVSGVCQANLHEGDSFVVEMQRSITIPNQATLDLSFEALTFDLSDPASINDAFEVALVDSRGVPLVQPFGTGRDAFLNVTEGQTPRTGLGTTLDQDEVRVDLSDIAEGTEANLIVRLINNDADTESRVSITKLALTPDAGAGVVGFVQGSEQPASQQVDFDLLTDVTASFDIDFATTSFDDQSKTLFADIAIMNRGQFEVDSPLLLVVDQVSQPGVVPAGFDGFTPDSRAYFDYSSLLAADSLEPGEGTELRDVGFSNPDELPFTFQPRILAQLNHAPEFVSQPVRDVLSEMEYRYDADAVDQDGDSLTYELASGPRGLTIDAASGELQWTPTVSDVGNHSILLRVDDGRGGIDEQEYTIEVLLDPSNRPPMITSEPVISSLVGQPYEYIVTASDPDQDPLTFGLMTFPTGMVINADTGLIQWTPRDNQLGEQPVTVTVSDGRGGSAGQSFAIRVGADPSNRPPIIISDPVTVFDLPGMVNPPTGDISPEIITRNLAIGETATETVALTLSDTGLASADIVFVVDESESMQGEHAWMVQMIPDLEEALLEKGIGPNRYAIVGFGGFNDHAVSHFHNLHPGSSFFLYDSENQPLDSTGIEGVLPEVLIDATLPSTGDYVLVVAGHTAGDAVTYGFQPVFASTTTTEVELGPVVKGTIETPGDVGKFTFTLDQPSDILLDVLSFQFGFEWTLEGPSGVLASDIFGFFFHDESLYGVPAGEYTITVEAPGDFIGDYYFRILDIPQAATPIQLGTSITDTLVPHRESQIYQFEVTDPNSRYYFDIEEFTTTDTVTLSTNPANTRYRLVDPFGEDIFENLISKTSQSGRDLEVVTLPFAGTYTLIFETKAYALGQADYTFAIHAFADEPQPLVFGERIDGEIGTPGELDIYSFTLDTPAQLTFDSFTDNVEVEWNLDGPRGRVIDRLALDRSDGRSNTDAAAVLELIPGDYQLTIDTDGDQTFPYSFRLLDLESATPIGLGEEVSGQLSPGNETDLFQFDAAAGDAMFFDFLTVGSGDVEWRLADPLGRILFRNPSRGNGSDEDRLILPTTGTYTLFIEGQIRNTDPTDYSFAVYPAPNVSTPLNLGTTTAGEFATPGVLNSYTFTVSDHTFAYFDSLTNNAEISWSLTGPSGSLVSERALSASDATRVTSPILNLVPGEYVLELDAQGDTTGGFQFRLHDLESAPPLAPGTPVSGELSPANETDLYQFAVNSGDMFAFDSVAGTVPSSTTWRLIDPYRRVVFSDAFANDVDAITLNRTGNYTLLVEAEVATTDSGNYEFNVEFLGNTPPTPLTGDAITLGDDITGSIDAGGETDIYNFSLSNRALLYFDSLTNNNALRWSLVGPTGTTINARPFGSSDAGRESAPSILNLVPGDYALTVTATSAAGSYGFRLSDLAAATQIQPDTPVTGELDPANESMLYRFDAVEGEAFTFESEQIDGPRNARWRLVDPFGRIVFSTGLQTDVLRQRLEFTGSYTLLVEGQINDTQPGTYQFTVHRIDETRMPLTLGDVTSGSIDVGGDVDFYSFTVDSASRFHFDSLTPLSLVTWSLTGPAGRLFNAVEFSQAESGTFGLIPGEYTLTVDGTRDATGEYSFRLSDISSGTQIFPGSATSGMLEPGNETDIYQFSATAGELFYFDLLDASATNSRWQLVDPLGGLLFSDFLGNPSRDDVDTIELQRTGDYTLMVVGSPFIFDDISYAFNVKPVTHGREQIAIGDVVAGSIGVSGELDEFSFSVSSPTSLYFDALAGQFNFEVTVSGPAGVLVDSARLSEADGVIPAPLEGLPTGEYTVTIDAPGDDVGDYEFRVLDLATAAPLSLGQPTTTSLSPGSASELYAFEVDAGQPLFFDWVRQFGSAQEWTLVDNFGQVVFDRPTTGPSPTATARAAGTYVLVVEGSHDAADSESMFTAYATTISNAPLSLDTAVTAGIETPGDEDQYFFTQLEDRRVYFDYLSGDGSLTWEIRRPNGALVAGDDFSANPQELQFIELIPGDYIMTIDAEGNDTGDYSFQLIDIDSAPNFDPGTPLSGTLTPATATNAYRFEASAGEEYFPEVVNSPNGARAIWRILDPDGRVVAFEELNRPSQRLELVQTGTYTLLVEGANRDTQDGAYELIVHPAVANSFPLSLGETISGEIETPGAINRYQFNVDAPTLLNFDSQTGSNQLAWTVTGPGQSIFRTFSADDVPFRALPGQYTVEIDGFGTTGEYRFRLLDLADAPPLPLDTVVDGTLDPLGEVDPYQFTAAAGDQFELEVTNRSGASNTRWRLVSEFGVVEESQRLNEGVTQLAISRPGTYSLLVESFANDTATGNYSLELRFTGNEPVPPVDGTPLALSTPTSGSISEAGEQDFYTFTVPSDSFGYFDALTNNGRLFWQLTGPAGVVDTATFLASPTVHRLFPGDYVLRVSAQGATTADYDFQFLDLDAATPLTIGDSIFAALDPGDSTDAYRFDAMAGERYLFDSFSAFRPANWRLVDPFGGEIFPRNFAEGPFDIEHTGVYTLLVEGGPNAFGPVDYGFRIARADRVIQTGEMVTGSIDVAHKNDEFIFNGRFGQRLYFDAFDTTSTTFIAMISPSGEQVLNARTIQNVGPFTLPETGEYRLIARNFSGTGDYSFRLLDVADAPRLSADNVAEGTLDPALESDIYVVSGNIGERFQIIADREMRTGTALQASIAARDTLIAAGSIEDGYETIKYTFAQDPFRTGTAKNVILVTDEDRDVFDTEVTFGDIFSIMDSRSARLNVVANAVLNDGDGNRALGVAADGTTFQEAAMGGFTTNTGGTFISGSGTTKADYVDLAWALDGAAFDLNLLRAGGNVATSFSNAFVEYKSQEIQQQFQVDLIASDPSAPFENLTGQLAGIDGTVTFDARLTGDGAVHSFDLQVVLAGTGVVLGTVPVILNVEYASPVEAIDPDGDVVTYTLLEAPSGASIDPQTGHIDWEPGVPGDYRFVVQASDGRGGEDTQEYTVSVSAGRPNEAPLVTSTPLTEGTVDQPYSYTVTAEDPDGHTPFYFATTVPDGLSIDRVTGEVTWTPTELQVGSHPVTIQVRDGFGGQVEQQFTIEVVEDSDNQPPEIISEPSLGVISGQPYRYQARAVDPNADPLQFDLVAAPMGMSVDPATGQVAWRPLDTQTGVHNVFLRVTDGRDGVDLQAFRLTVVPDNTAPVITSQPGAPAVVGRPYVYLIQTQDAEGDALTFGLTQAPESMVVDADSGLVRWTPTAGQVGAHAVTATVADGQGGEATQSFVLQVVADANNQAPVISSTPRDTIGLGQTYLYLIAADDPNHDPLTYRLASAPSGMTVDNRGLVSWDPTPSQLGSHAVQLQVEDGQGGETTQSFNLLVTSLGSNRAPQITSRPPLAGTVDRPYEYRPEAIDADGDPLAWMLDEAPMGMSIDAAQGTIRWTPSILQVGEQEVVVRVFDVQGGTTTQQFTIQVRAANLPPVIESVPPIDATATLDYFYEVLANDPEMDPLTYSLALAPDGMSIDSETGVIEWQPDIVGATQVAILVQDDQGAAALQEFDLIVHRLGVNRAPRITSFPQTKINAGMLFEYQLEATDPEGAPVSFSFGENLSDFEPLRPQGMTLDPDTGFVQWIPPIDRPGIHTASWVATDPAGSHGIQIVEIRVFPADTALTIGSLPVTTATAGMTYRYDVQVNDTSGAFVSYALADAPTGMEIDQLGRITWPTDIDDLGTYPVELIVSNDRGLSVTQAYEVTVVADTELPQLMLTITPNPADLGEEVTVVASATDNVGVSDVVVSLDGTILVLDQMGQAVLTPNAAGQFEIAATAVDAAGNSVDLTRNLTVIDRSDVNAPVVSISSPAQETELTAPAPVIGTVTDDNLLFYTIEVAAVPNGDFTEIFRGTEQVVDDVLGDIDPSLLRNDSYRLRVTAQDTGGNTSRDEVLVYVSGDLKVGNFTLSFTDLSLPVAGVPLSIVRTYDSLNASEDGELGFGWTMDFLNVDIRTSVRSTGSPGLFEPFEDGTRVYVTLPSGVRHGFTFEPQLSIDVLQSTYGFVDFIYEAKFTPDPGVHSELTVEDAFLTRNNGKYYVFGPGAPYNPGDPLANNRYTLTNKFGVEYLIDPKTSRIREIKTPPGDTLTVTPRGLVSSDGPELLFERDSQGRIRRVTDPSGNTIEYTYDANGDLVAVKDRENFTTEFKYESPFEHYLTEVVDPLGRTGFRTDYGPDGRVQKIFDANGDPIEFQYLPDENTERIFDANGNPTTYKYDDRGNVLQILDALGGLTEYEVDADGNVTSLTGPLGNTSTAIFDDKGNQTSATNALGHTSYQTFNEDSQLTTTVDPLGFTTTFSYDSNGNATGVTDALGQTTTLEVANRRLTGGTYATAASFSMEYDHFGNVERRHNVDGTTTEYSWDDNRRKLSETTTRTINGELTPVTTRFVYDREGRPTTVVLPDETPDSLGDNPRLSTEYNAIGQVTATTDMLGRRTELEYDLTGRLKATHYPDGFSESWTYDAFGNNITYTNRSGQTTTYEYDELNRRVRTILPDESPEDLTDNPVFEVVYDAASRVVAEIDAAGNRTDLEYDSADRLARMLLPEVLDATTNELVRPTFVYSYDDRGQQRTLVDPSGGVWQFEYDNAARLLATTDPAGNRVSKTYDALGRPVTETDSLGRTTTYGYDMRGLTTSVTLPAPTTGEERPVYTYEYDEAALLLSQTDPLGRVTSYTYDLLGRRVGQTLPGGESSSAEYDDAGNLTESIDFNGQRTTFEYDALNRVERQVFADGSQHLFTYHPSGQIASVQTPEGTASFEYDAQDRLINFSDVLGQQISYEYNINSRQTAVTTDAGSTQFVYGPGNRLNAVVDQADRTTTYGYDVMGNVTTTVLPNGHVETRQYDDAHRLVFVGHEDNSGGVINSFSYVLDAVGRRTSVTEASGRQVNYVYDALDRLTSERINHPATGERMVAYEYDHVGNRLSRDDSLGGITTYSYDSNDRLLQEVLGGVTTSYEYDDNGSLIAKRAGADETTYTWDARRRMTRVDVEAAGGLSSVQYTYGADGTLVGRTADGVQTRYVVDRNRAFSEVLEERTEEGAVIASYTQGIRLLSQTRDGETVFYHVDGIGSTRALSDAAGQVVDQYDYDAFGRTLTSVGTNINEYLFAGERRDPLTGLDYLRARYLDTATGRFLSVDPFDGDLRSPESLHRYGYVSNNPVNAVDPSGQTTMVEVNAVSSISSINSSLATASQINRACSLISSVEFLSDAIQVLSFFSFLSFNISDIFKSLTGLDSKDNAPVSGGFRFKWEAPTVKDGSLKKIEIKLAPKGPGVVGFEGEIEYEGFGPGMLAIDISRDFKKTISSLQAGIKAGIPLKDITLCKRTPLKVGEVKLGLGAALGGNVGKSGDITATANLQFEFGVANPANGELTATFIEFGFPIVKAVAKGGGGGRLELGGFTVIK